MLLAGNADAVDARAVDLGGDGGDGGVERGGPFRRMLFHVSGREPRDEGMRRAGLGHDAAGVEVERDRLGALGATVDADEESHGKIGVE